MSRRKAAKGAGLRQRADGRWEGRLRLGNGQRKSVFGKTKDEARRKLAEVAVEHDKGLPVHDDALRLKTWLAEWLETVVDADNRPRTVEGYRIVVERHLVPELGNVRLTALTPSHVRRLLKAKTGEGLAPRTVRNIHAVLRRALEVARRDELVSRNVAALVSAPSAERPKLRMFDEDQSRAFLRAIEGHKLEGYFTVLLALGLRRGEGCALKWADCDFETQEIHVRQNLQRVGGKLRLGPTKTHRSARPLPMLPMVESALRRQRVRQAEARLLAGKSWKGEGDFVFTSAVGGPLEPRNVNRVLAAVCAAEQASATKEERQPTFPPINVHGLRHSMVTVLRAEGVPDRVIAELVGHSRVSTTSDVYGRVLDSVVREAATAMERALSGTDS